MVLRTISGMKKPCGIINMYEELGRLQSNDVSSIVRVPVHDVFSVQTSNQLTAESRDNTG
jgi:hypothetical protein